MKLISRATVVRLMSQDSLLRPGSVFRWPRCGAARLAEHPRVPYITPTSIMTGVHPWHLVVSRPHAYVERVLKSLVKVVEGTPEVENFEVCTSTFHKIAARS